MSRPLDGRDLLHQNCLLSLRAHVQCRSSYMETVLAHNTKRKTENAVEGSQKGGGGQQLDPNCPKQTTGGV